MCGEENNTELSVAERKKILRKKAKTVLNEYFSDKELAKAASDSICDFFLKSELYKNASVIFGFMPMADEVNIIPILRKALADGKKVALPRMIPGSNGMDFYTAETFESGFTSDNVFGIKEPGAGSAVIERNSIPENAVFLVPGLAFNLSGARLGRGKGYYDCYLSCIRDRNDIALCGVCIVPVITKGIPCEKNDIFVTHILNEYGLVKCSEGIYHF